MGHIVFIAIAKLSMSNVPWGAAPIFPIRRGSSVNEDLIFAGEEKPL
jgi:hypothetical protein